MIEATEFDGQDWDIMPAARAVNEVAPANISRQRWLLVLSGVAIVTRRGKTSDDCPRDEIRIRPDMRGPLDFAISRYGLARPQGTEGLNYEAGFQLRQWSPFAGLSSAFDQDQSVNGGFAVDGWRPSPFASGPDAFSGRQVNGLFAGIVVSAAARDSGAWLYRVGYNITLTGRIVFTQIGNVPRTLTALRGPHGRGTAIVQLFPTGIISGHPGLLVLIPIVALITVRRRSTAGARRTDA
jgi:hypothetical protein